MKRTLCALALLLAVVGCACAQVKGSVVLIRPCITTSGRTTFTEIADGLFQVVPEEISNYFRGLSKGNGWGSGFLVNDGDGHPMVITAKHVMVFALHADLEFTDDAGITTRIEKCPVIYEDDNIDLAILRVPQDKLPSSAIPLSFCDYTPPDGTEVWSAGYPGLGKDPAWQLAKGNIFNRILVNAQMGVPQFDVFIQHSAPLDPGNSGGPLLVGSPSDPAKMKVVGLNTWIALNRQAANYSVPVDLIREPLQRFASSTQEDARTAVYEKALSLIVTLKSTKPERFVDARYISSFMVSHQGWDYFNLFLRPFNQDYLKEWIPPLIVNPFICLQDRIYLGLYDSLQGKSLEIESLEPLSTDQYGVPAFRSILCENKKEFIFDWYKEQGCWHIFSMKVPYVRLSQFKKTIAETDAPVIKEKED